MFDATDRDGTSASRHAWQKVGGLEAEEFLDAVESGRQRPLITEWKRKAANRHGPGLRQRRFQRLAVLLSVALQRGGTDKKAARRQAAALLAEVLAQPISRRAVEHWELESDLPLCAEEEAVIKAALARGSDPASVVRHFRGLIKFPNLLDSREALTVLGNPPMLEN